jgi:hypothetical protein
MNGSGHIGAGVSNRRKNPARIKAGRGKFVLSAGVNIPRQAKSYHPIESAETETFRPSDLVPPNREAPPTRAIMCMLLFVPIAIIRNSLGR